jgi:hypothetical protein
MTSELLQLIAAELQQLSVLTGSKVTVGCKSNSLMFVTQGLKMRIAKMCSLAGFLVLCLSGSLWADSVTQNDVAAAFKITQSDINQDLKTYESSRVLQSEFIDAGVWDAAGLRQLKKGHISRAEADFSAAIADLKLVANGLTPSPAVPDADALGLLSCSGLLLFGAMKKKFF